jgi:hypothetical protein
MNGGSCRTKPRLKKEGEYCLGTESIVAILFRRDLLVILHLLGYTRRKDVEDRE